MNGIREWVEELASPDAGRREAAGEELYRAGRELVEDIFARWRQNPEFAVLITGKPIVGVAVPPELFERIRQETDMPPLAAVPEEQSTGEFEFEADDARLDILTPVDNQGAIQKFLDRFGPGVQQVELPVINVAAATQVLAERFGLSPVYPEPRPGANGTRVNFFLVDRPGGGKVLIELFEAKR